MIGVDPHKASHTAVAISAADLDHQVGLPSSQHRPCPLPEACGRPGRQRRQLRLALRERQPGERDQARRHVAVDLCRQAQVQRPVR
jgi:hypothetical protein